jgi:adenylate cyclase
MDPKFEELLLQFVQADNKTLQDEIEKTLWQEFGTTKAILIMDMSGFSRLTQKYGIVHYLSMVKRMQMTVQPIIEQLDGRVVKFEADNCYAMFDTVLAAVRASIRMNTAFDAINRFTEDTFDIRVSIGIDYGDVLLIGGPDYFGETVNVASKLGEDVAGPGEILITEKAFSLLPPSASYTGKPIAPVLSGVRIKAISLDFSHH